MSIFFPVKIMKIVDGAKYNGVVYDQYVTVRSVDAQQITLFDQSCLIKDEMKGKNVKISAQIFTGINFKPGKNKTKKYEIVQPLYANAALKGKLLSLKVKGAEYKELEGLLGVGGAKFYFDCLFVKNLKNGDFVSIGSRKDLYRLDISEIG